MCPLQLGFILGDIMMDTKSLQFELPQNKLEAENEKIKDLQKRKNVTLQSLQSLICLLQLAFWGIEPGHFPI